MKKKENERQNSRQRTTGKTKKKKEQEQQPLKQQMYQENRWQEKRETGSEGIPCELQAKDVVTKRGTESRNER